MRKVYSLPDLDYIELKVKSDVLAVSDPEPTVPGGGGGSSELDPFEEM